MITLFVIIVIATLVLAATRAEGMRPLGLALIGTISLVLGARATAVFTEISVAPLVNSMVFAQDADTQDTDATEAPAASDENADDKSETTGSTTATDEPTGEPQESERTSGPKSDGTSADEEKTDATPDDSVIDDAAAAEAAAIHGTQPDSNAAASDASPDLNKAVTVEAITNVKYLDRDDDTPSWLEVKPWTKDGVHFVPVVSRLQISEEDRDSALVKEIKEATDAYINQLLKNKHATKLLNLRSGSTVPRVTESFEEQVAVTEGTVFHQSHALLSFDDDFRGTVSAKWDEVRAASRLMQTGLGAGIVILLLSTMFSYFKLDTATRGYYTGRLQFAAAAAILAVIAASVLFANYVPWM
ncbi:MAG: hypothetical protein QGF59_15550 [Pirellulaceae bacterium]|nr:hypothetical protein [Pirellulaceae bacterium]